MPPLIDTFLANIKQNGFVKSNRFVAMIRPNNFVANALGYSSGLEIANRLAVTCYSASIQAPTLFTHEFGVTNPARLIPYGWNSNNASGMSMEFYLLGDYFEKEIFHQWMRTIVNPETRNVAYYDDFAKGTEIDIVLLPNFVRDFEELLEFVSNNNTDRTTSQFPGYTFTEVYPYMYTFNTGSVNYSPVNVPTSVRVDFMFREMHPFNWKPSSMGTIIQPNDYNAFRAEVVNSNLVSARAEFQQYVKSLNKISYEKQKIAEQYNQSRNIPRGVDGELLNPKVDGLPAENPYDRIRRSLFGALSFVQQGRGFGIF
jgi:hypothetical protein